MRNNDQYIQNERDQMIVDFARMWGRKEASLFYGESHNRVYRLCINRLPSVRERNWETIRIYALDASLELPEIQTNPSNYTLSTEIVKALRDHISGMSKLKTAAKYRMSHMSLYHWLSMTGIKLPVLSQLCKKTQSRAGISSDIPVSSAESKHDRSSQDEPSTDTARSADTVAPTQTNYHFSQLPMKNQNLTDKARSLPKYLRTIWILHYERGESRAQIAKTLALSIHTVRGHIRDARRRMGMQWPTQKKTDYDSILSSFELSPL